jgi:hypothetical protein
MLTRDSTYSFHALNRTTPHGNLAKSDVAAKIDSKIEGLTRKKNTKERMTGSKIKGLAPMTTRKSKAWPQ